MEALSKEKTWKEILNEFPEGVLLVNHEKKIVYNNHATYSSLGLNPERGLTDLNSVNTQLDLTIKDKSPRNIEN
jgi:nitrogen-specific signal transduction histidine kinase